MDLQHDESRENDGNPPSSPSAAAQPIRPKRPRFFTTAPGCAELGNKFKFKRLQSPSEIPGLNDNPQGPNSNHKCTYCQLPGTVRECEGELLGPFEAPARGKTPSVQFYAHRQCALWAPQVFETEQGTLQGLVESRKHAKGKKCLFCNDKGASLGCIYGGKQCCRPMHFRCALLGGASLRDGFRVMCPKHSEFTLDDDIVSQFIERTPITEVLIKPGNGCKHCNGSSYDRTLGSILTCNSCLSRAHVSCIMPNAVNSERREMFARFSVKGKHYCDNCMTCSSCDKPVNSHEYEQARRQMAIALASPDFSVDHDPNEDGNLLVCCCCNHFAVHMHCLPENQRKSWRCDRCRTCKHCSEKDISVIEWDESQEACADCVKQMRAGAVICPICGILYRDFEDIPMVQCDYCDSWIHAVKCGDMTLAEFKSLDEDIKYRCPICVEKKSKNTVKRRSKTASRDRRPTTLKESKAQALNSILQRLPPVEEEVAFYNVRTSSRDDIDVPEKVMADLAIDTELCRLCCSSGFPNSLYFCVRCGESYHMGCHDVRAGKVLGSSRQNGAVDKWGWHCFECSKHVSAFPSVSANGDPAGSKVGKLDHPNSEHAVNGTSLSGVNSSNESCTWDDERTCGLCGEEERDGFLGGCLFAWGSSVNADICDVWVHLMCVIWSTGVTVHKGEKGTSSILGPRRKVLLTARRTRCSSCGKPGATVRCSSGSCGRAYHVVCAEKASLTFSVNMKDNGHGESVIKACSEGMLKLFCPRHADKHETPDCSILETPGKMALVGVIRVMDSQGFVLHGESERRRVVAMDRTVSMRSGSLSVLRFGKLVPEVDSFIVKGCLVPLGYCAARRYWSIERVGQRCTYFVEVSGHAQSGPIFIVSCHDGESFRVESDDIDEVWATVRKKVLQALLGTVGKAVSFVSHEDESGLAAFGLDKCVVVTRHIESLALSSLFGNRYQLKSGIQPKCSDVVFYESLSNKYIPPSVRFNTTGSARSEGYASRIEGRRRRQGLAQVGPTYENMRSGVEFQLEVAREVLYDEREEQWEAVSHHRPEMPKTGSIDNPRTSTQGRRRRSLTGGAGRHIDVDEESLMVENEAAVKREDELDLSGQTVGEPIHILAPNAKRTTRILRSEIDGWGVFATEDISAQQLLMEYVGEIIRPVLSDLREAQYQDMGIGCYMFEITTGVIADATVCGNAARYINHSCAPNCYSKTVTLDTGRQVVAIFSKRRIQRGEELSYDYQFPFDETDRVKCGCGAAQCKGYMN